jgi:F-type H+-transporting ATPase subunit b
MRKAPGVWVLLLASLALAASPVFGQHESPAGEKAAEEHGNLEIWKWANFLLLAGGLGYLIQKNAGPYFAARSTEITKDLADSEKIRRDAEASAAAVEKRIANLGAEIAALRSEAAKERAADQERIRVQTAADIAKIQQHAEQEIASAAKAARMELQRYTAQLAVELATQKIRGRITPQTQDTLVRGFLHDIEPPSVQAHS